MNSPLHTNVALAKAERSTAVGCFDRAQPAAVKIGPLVSEITWFYTKDELPDDDITVLIAGDQQDGIWIGFHDDGEWWNADASPVNGSVYAWAQLPPDPPLPRSQKGGAS